MKKMSFLLTHLSWFDVNFAEGKSQRWSEEFEFALEIERASQSSSESD